MPSYATFTTPRTTVPDPIALRTAVQVATSDPTAVLFNLGGGWTGKKAAPWSPGDLSATQATLDTTPEWTPALRRTQQFLATSRQKDILAMIALVVRAKNQAVWNAMTIPQKIAATLAEADVWITVRDFI
jgi:hypothetical protein